MIQCGRRFRFPLKPRESLGIFSHVVRQELQGPQTAPASRPPLCKPPPSRRRLVSRRCGSARWSGQSFGRCLAFGSPHLTDAATARQTNDGSGASAKNPEHWRLPPCYLKVPAPIIFESSHRTLIPGWSATLSATCKAAENDCLERRNSIRPCVPSHVAYKAERGGNELFWSPWKMYSRSQERRRNREATVYLPALGGDGPRLDRMIRIYKCSQASSAEESLKCCAALLAVSTET